MVFRLFYTSRCTIRNEMDAKNASDFIAAQAAIKNQTRNITGAITFDGNDFAQILEGDKLEVLKLFELIKQDSRHENIILLKQKECSKRHFTNWAMRKLDSTNYDELVLVMAE